WLTFPCRRQHSRRRRHALMPAKKDRAEGEPASPVARSTISSPERSEASEGEMLLIEFHRAGGADPLAGDELPVLDAVAHAVAVVLRRHGPRPRVEGEEEHDDEHPEDHRMARLEHARASHVPMVPSRRGK